MSRSRRSVRLAPQVVAFIHAQAPETRRRLRLAFRALEQGRGDIKSLEGALDGYHRLRVGSCRVILRYDAESTTCCVFAERRSMVYVMLEELLDRGLRATRNPP